MKCVSEWMTRDVVAVGDAERLGTAEALLTEHRFRHLPVVRDGKVVGLLSQRDLLRARQTSGIEAPMWVAEAMTRDVKTVRPDTSLREALKTLREGKLGCLVVTDGPGTLLGIITEGDAVRLGEALTAEADLLEEAAEYDA